MLLHRLASTLGVFTFFAKGEEKPLAHHKSQRKPFEVYAGAEYSPYFCNLRTANNAGEKQGMLDAGMMEQIGEALLGLALEDVPNLRYLTGIPNAGHPIAEAVRMAASLYVSQSGNVLFDKNEGDGGRYFTCREQEKVELIQAVFDDVITVADVKFRFLKALGHKPPLYVLIDRQEGGVEILEAMGYEVRSVFGIDDVLEASVDCKRIDLETAERVQSYAARRRKLIREYMDEIVADLKQEVL